MSASIAAAQRRRAGPPDTGRPGGGPKPSINSAQAFHQSASGMPRPNMPTGKLAGQHAVQQQAMDRQQYAANQKAQAQAQQGEPDFSKITVAQAITLITLRLGKLENAFYKLQMESELGGSNNVSLEGMENSNLKLVDGSVIDSIVARLESLEKRGTVSGASSSQEVATLKQQVDLIKPSIVTLKNASITNTKDIKSLNDQLTSMFEEINMLKAELQGLYSSSSLEVEGEVEGEGGEESATSLEDLQVDLSSEFIPSNGKLDLTNISM